MVDELNQLIVEAAGNQEQASQLIERLFAVAEPGTVFSEPTTVEDRTVITASEVSVAMGVGYGVGGGSSQDPDEGPESGVGGGGGGGGASMGRPVAVISVGSGGVRVEPVVDVTKIALTLFTVISSVVFVVGRMIRAERSRE
jgi:uncharacterized spore protein YtfJ